MMLKNMKISAVSLSVLPPFTRGRRIVGVNLTHNWIFAPLCPKKNFCHVQLYLLYCSNSSIGTSSASFPTIAFATFQTCMRLSSAALQSTHGSFKFQLKSDMRFVWPPCMKSLAYCEHRVSYCWVFEGKLTTQEVHPPHRLVSAPLPRG